MPIQTAESGKSRKESKRALAHIEIHRKMDGGHIVRHVYHGFGHEPTDHHFNSDGVKKGGEHIMSHLQKHAGLPGLEGYDRKEASETEEEIEA